MPRVMNPDEEQPSRRRRRLMKPLDAANFLCISRDTLRRARKKKQLPLGAAYKNPGGNVVLYDVDAILAHWDQAKRKD